MRKIINPENMTLSQLEKLPYNFDQVLNHTSKVWYLQDYKPELKAIYIELFAGQTFETNKKAFQFIMKKFCKGQTLGETMEFVKSKRAA